MNKLRMALALVGATATGVIAFTAPAIADDAGGLAYKRDDSSGKVITTADLDDDDDEANKSTNTGTNTNTGRGNTGPTTAPTTAPTPAPGPAVETPTTAGTARS